MNDVTQIWPLLSLSGTYIANWLTPVLVWRHLWKVLKLQASNVKLPLNSDKQPPKFIDYSSPFKVLTQEKAFCFLLFVITFSNEIVIAAYHRSRSERQIQSTQFEFHHSGTIMSLAYYCVSLTLVRHYTRVRHLLLFHNNAGVLQFGALGLALAPSALATIFHLIQNQILKLNWSVLCINRDLYCFDSPPSR